MFVRSYLLCSRKVPGQVDQVFHRDGLRLVPVAQAQKQISVNGETETLQALYPQLQETYTVYKYSWAVKSRQAVP